MGIHGERNPVAQRPRTPEHQSLSRKCGQPEVQLLSNMELPSCQVSCLSTLSVEAPEELGDGMNEPGAQPEAMAG